MDTSVIQSGVFLLIVVASIVAMFMGNDKSPRKGSVTMAEDDMVDDGTTTSVISRVTESVSKLDVKKNAEGVIESIKGIPLSVIPNSTIGEMAKAIREYSRNKVTDARMSFSAATAIAADIVRLRHAKKAVQPEPEPKEEGESKGKADLNAA